MKLKSVQNHLEQTKPLKTQTMKNNNYRAQQAILLLWIIIGLAIVNGVSSFMQYQLLQQLKDGVSIPDDQIDLNDLREAIIGMVYLVGYIVCAVKFIQWFRRAYYNLHTVSNTLVYEEKWAAISWFIPFFNLYGPYVIMKELFEETNYFLAKKDNNFVINHQQSIIGLWWGLWVIIGFISQMAIRITFSSVEIDNLIISTQLILLEIILSIPTALLAINLIKKYNVLENQLWAYRDQENSIDDKGMQSDQFDESILDRPI